MTLVISDESNDYSRRDMHGAASRRTANAASDRRIASEPRSIETHAALRRGCYIAGGACLPDLCTEGWGWRCGDVI
jgi:hypothetical protein